MTIEARLNYSTAKAPTIMREPIRRLLSLTGRYLDDDPEERTGWAVALHGGHGTGKSHSLLVTLKEATRPDRVRESKLPLALYVRADGPEPVTLYRKLMAQLSLGELQLLAEEAFSGYAAGGLVEAHGAAAEPGDVSTKLRDDPKALHRALEEKKLSWTHIITRQETDMQRIQRSLGRYERPVRGLLQPELAASAREWLTGVQLDGERLKDLGVTGNIEDADEARLGIQVLASLAHVAQRPFLLVMDQVESLVMTPDGTLEQANAGWLRGLLEAVASESGFLVAAMSDRAWAKVPEDLKMRFGPSVIPVRGLTEEEAKLMLEAYLAPWEPEPALFPFTIDAIRPMLAHSGGVARRFLQTARLAFDLAAESRAEIDAALVGEATATSPQRPPTEEQTRAVVELVLGRTQPGYRADFRVDGHRVDYAVVRGGQPTLYIKLSGAVFASDEAEEAVASVTTIKVARERRVPIVLVVQGYSSPEVTGRLEQAATRVVVAQDERFEETFRDAVDESLHEPVHDVGTMLDGLDDLQTELSRIAETRGRDERLVEDRLKHVDREIAGADRARQLQAYRQSWGQERERLQREVDGRQAERRRADVDEVVEQHAAVRVSALQRRRFGVLFGALAVAFGGVVVALTAVGSAGFVLVGLAVVAGLAGEMTSAMVRSRERARGIVRSAADLERVSREAVRTSADEADPYVRYGEVLIRGAHMPTGELLARAEGESLALLRRRFTAAAAARGEEDAGDALRRDFEPSTLAIAVETAARLRPPGVDDRLSTLSEPLQQLAVLSGWWRGGDRFLDRFLELASDKAPADTTPESLLAQGFLHDDDDALMAAVAVIPERHLRRSIALLSPLDDDGLGSWYWLNAAGQIEDLFFFFRKAAFLAAGGVSAPAPEQPPAIPEFSGGLSASGYTFSSTSPPPVGAVDRWEAEYSARTGTLRVQGRFTTSATGGRTRVTRLAAQEGRSDERVLELEYGKPGGAPREIRMDYHDSSPVPIRTVRIVPDFVTIAVRQVD